MAEVAQQKVSEIRPFRVDVPEAQLTDLRRRINATIWPEQENDPSQGVALKTAQALARYWGTDYAPARSSNSSKSSIHLQIPRLTARAHPTHFIS